MGLGNPAQSALEHPLGANFQVTRRGPSRLVLAYALTIFASAFLLFQVQPIITKMILPWFGGAAAVWSVCLLFFQTTLLLGYLYAHLLTQKFGPRNQARIHVVFLAASLAFLPILPRVSLKPSGLEDPTYRVLTVLAVTIGVPFLLLSSTSPLLQSWYSRSSSSPYRLYALSNAGSMLALLSYPLIVEPKISNRRQALTWSIAYALVVILCAGTAFADRSTAAPALMVGSGPAPDCKAKSLWAALAACGSALLLSVTNHISQNIAAVPLLWIIPLSLYLLTFIICFEGHSWYGRGIFLRLLAVALASMAYAIAPGRGNLPPYVLIPLFCAGLFACCMVCHGELAKLKPPPAHLTSFYLLVALGGAMGAVFVALLAPRLFAGYYELPISLGFCGVLIHIVLHRDRDIARLSSPRSFVLLALLVIAFCLSLYISARRQASQARVRVRNFYGVLRVEDRVAPGVILEQGNSRQLLDPDPHYRDLINGTIEHGIQFLSASRRLETTTYYGAQSGVALAIQAAETDGAVKAGIIGLGAGTIAAYGRGGDHYTFYEINPLVVELANNQFSFLRQSAAKITIVPGDARLSLERQSPQAFDILAVDAFTSDSIPVHLLTREAFALYLRHLKPEGIIAVHVSNRYLDLAPVVRGAAASLGLTTRVIDSSGNDSRAIYRATWTLVGRETGLLSRLPSDSENDSNESPTEMLWTDDYSSILPTFK
jgi:SAM-dependent methyltransferase